MSMKRRKFIIGSLAGIFSLATYGAYKYLSGFSGEIIVSILERRLGYLNVDNKSFVQFARDYIVFKASEKEKLKIISVFSLPLKVYSPYRFLEQGNPIRRLENDVVTKYLLSTNFFTLDDPDNEPVDYLGFYDPLLRPCQNPLMRPA